MHLRLPVFLVSFLLVAFGMARALAQSAAQFDVKPGQVLLTAVRNSVFVTTEGGAETRITTPTKVDVKSVIRTGQESSVIMVFSNRAQTQLGETTKVKIDEFRHDITVPSDTGGDPEVEAGKSDTILALDEGVLSGQVKLRKDGGSNFTIKTPVGAAGIRGTTFRIVYRPPGTGQAFGSFQLINVNGRVDFTPGGGGPGAPGGGQPPGGAPGQPTPPGSPPVSATGTISGVAIPQNTQIEIVVVQNAQGQFVPQVPVSSNSAQPIPTALAQTITQISVAIAQAVTQVTLPTAPPSTPGTPGTTGTPGAPGTGDTGTGTPGTSGQPGTGQQTGTQTTQFTATAGGATATGTVTQPPPPRIPENVNTSTAGPR